MRTVAWCIVDFAVLFAIAIGILSAWNWHQSREAEIAYLTTKNEWLRDRSHEYIGALLAGANEGSYTIYIGDVDSVTVHCKVDHGWWAGRYYEGMKGRNKLHATIRSR